jgi:hypothetical protein
MYTCVEESCRDRHGGEIRKGKKEDTLARSQERERERERERESDDIAGENRRE